LWRIAFWLAVGAVAVGSLTPTPYLPPQAFDIWDKAQHAIAFALMAILGLRSYPSSPLIIALSLLGYGALIEIVQSLTGWRFGDWQDWLADSIGVAMVYLGWIFWKPSA
jgi:VanZ family protein